MWLIVDVRSIWSTQRSAEDHCWVGEKALPAFFFASFHSQLTWMLSFSRWTFGMLHSSSLDNFTSIVFIYCSNVRSNRRHTSDVLFKKVSSLLSHSFAISHRPDLVFPPYSLENCSNWDSPSRLWGVSMFKTIHFSTEKNLVELVNRTVNQATRLIGSFVIRERG